MRPRVILKTHSGVRRPGVFSILVARCTSPTQSAYQEDVVKKLAAELKGVPGEYLKGASFGERGAAFHAVWMARPEQLGILASNMFWSSKGHAIRALARCDKSLDVRQCLDLDSAARLIYLKYYMEGDGAILLSLARELVSRGRLSDYELTQTDLVDRLLMAIWEEYLDLTSDVTERVRMRMQMERFAYPPSTRRHKTYPHLFPLEDFGLIEHKQVDDENVFFPAVREGRILMKDLLGPLANVKELEKSIAEGTLAQHLANVMFPGHLRYSYEKDNNALKKTAIEAYRTVVSSGAPICAIDTVIDISYAWMLTYHNVLATRQELRDLLIELESQNRPDIGFQVDRFGLAAYVIIADSLVNKILKE